MNTPATKNPKGAGHDRLLKYELTPIAGLTSAERNAREHGTSQLDALADSLSAFGVISPVIIDSRNRIVAGHGRVEAAKRAGKTVIATLQVEHLSETELRLFAIADNKIAERSTWNEAALALELQSLRIDAPDLDLCQHSIESLRLATAYLPP